MSKTEIHLLGPPRVIASGRILPIRRRKALALIAFLASSRTPHTRELLAATFWPEADPESAHAQIRNHLWVLRTAGLEPWLRSEGEMVALREAEDLWVDVREHRRLLALAGLLPGRTGAVDAKSESVLAEAVGIYREPFLAGFHLADSPSFDEWQLREADALRSGQEAALDALTRLREARGDLEGAVASASGRLELDPLDERALRALMALHARSGRSRKALECFERTRKLLEREMELPLSRETVLVRDRILARNSEPAPRPGPVACARPVLPDSPTPFVGRDQEIREITRYLDEPGLRLLTLTGPGGCGKTRLALETGRRLIDRFPDGVFFAPLTTIEAGSLLPAALAEVLSLPLGTGHRVGSPAGSARPGSLEELIDFLREKRLLIILDNLEQLSNDLESLRAIRTRTRGPVFLATSRTRLRLAGEQVLEVEGLPWPRRNTPPEDLPDHASVRLFLQSVRRIRASFTPSVRDLAAVAEICRRLRGHPLGIELAASWAHCLSIAEIARQVAGSVDLEAAPGADLPPRHRSLRAVFEHSWSLLSSEEKGAFRRLSRAPGSLDRAAALEIGRTTPQVFASLIEQSILRRTGNGRFEILETLRQFGRRKLSENVREERVVLDRAARHYLGKVIAARSSLEGPGQRKSLQCLSHDRHNLRQSWLHAAQRGWTREMTKALRPLFLFYDMYSRAAEGAEVFGSPATRKLPEKVLPGVRALRLASLSRVAQAWFLRFDDLERSRRLMRQGQRRLAKVGAPEERAFADALAAVIRPATVQDERDLREDALQCEKAGDLWCAGLCWEILAYTLCASDPAEGLVVIRRSLTVRRRGRDPWSIALGLYVLGLLLERRGLLRGARRRYEESLALRRRLKVDPDGIFSCLDGITRVALASGMTADALRHGGEALAIAQRRGDSTRIGRARTRLAQAHIIAGFPADAHPLLESALITAEERADPEWSSHLHALRGIVALEMGEAEEARCCLEQVLSPDPHRTPDPPTPGESFDSTGAWRAYLEARLTLDGGENAAARLAALNAIDQSARSHNEPLLAETLMVWTEWCARNGRPSMVDRVGSALLASAILPASRRNRLESLLRAARKEMKPAPAREPQSGMAIPGVFALAAEVRAAEIVNV